MMPSEDCLFLVKKNEKSKILRFLLSLFPGILLAELLGRTLSNYATIALIAGWPMLFGWFLVMRPNQVLEVHDAFLLHKNLLTNKEKTISYAEIRDAGFRGFFLFRYLILSDDSGKPLVRLEADMENLDRLVSFLREKHITVNETKERT